MAPCYINDNLKKILEKKNFLNKITTTIDLNEKENYF